MDGFAEGLPGIHLTVQLADRIWNPMLLHLLTSRTGTLMIGGFESLP